VIEGMTMKRSGSIWEFNRSIEIEFIESERRPKKNTAKKTDIKIYVESLR